MMRIWLVSEVTSKNGLGSDQTRGLGKYLVKGAPKDFWVSMGNPCPPKLSTLPPGKRIEWSKRRLRTGFCQSLQLIKMRLELCTNSWRRRLPGCPADLCSFAKEATSESAGDRHPGIWKDQQMEQIFGGTTQERSFYFLISPFWEW